MKPARDAAEETRREERERIRQLLARSLAVIDAMGSIAVLTHQTRSLQLDLRRELFDPEAE